MVMTAGNWVVRVLRYMRYLDISRNNGGGLPSILSFVRSYNRQQIIPFKELTRRIIAGMLVQGRDKIIPEKVWTSSNIIMNKQIIVPFVAKLLQRIGPQNVAHQSVRRRFTKPINLHGWLAKLVEQAWRTYHFQVIQRIHLGRKSPMNAQKLLVHNSR